MTEPDEFARTGMALVSSAILALVCDGDWWTITQLRGALFGEIEGRSSETPEHRLVSAVAWRLVDDDVVEQSGDSYRLAVLGTDD